MAKKIVFIGAGSVTFTRNLVRDILTFPAFSDAVISLVDISEANLAQAKAVVEKSSRPAHTTNAAQTRSSPGWTETSILRETRNTPHASSMRFSAT